MCVCCAHARFHISAKSVEIEKRKELVACTSGQNTCLIQGGQWSVLDKCTGCTIEKFVPKKRVHQLLGMYIVAYTNKIWYKIHRVHNESSAQGQGTI